MAGGGKMRSEWNQCLLEEAAAVAYTRLVLEAKKMLGPGDLYHSLWPQVLYVSPVRSYRALSRGDRSSAVSA